MAPIFWIIGFLVIGLLMWRASKGEREPWQAKASRRVGVGTRAGESPAPACPRAIVRRKPRPEEFDARILVDAHDLVRPLEGFQWTAVSPAPVLAQDSPTRPWTRFARRNTTRSSNCARRIFCCGKCSIAWQTACNSWPVSSTKGAHGAVGGGAPSPARCAGAGDVHRRDPETASGVRERGTDRGRTLLVRPLRESRGDADRRHAAPFRCAPAPSAARLRGTGGQHRPDRHGTGHQRPQTCLRYERRGLPNLRRIRNRRRRLAPLGAGQWSRRLFNRRRKARLRFGNEHRRIAGPIR